MERIAFLVESTGARLGCLLNPDSLVVRRNAGIRQRGSTSGPLTGVKLADNPLLYTGGGTTELTLDLLFDVTLAGSTVNTEDVRELTRPLWELAENTARENGLSKPPLVRFVWGKSWNILGVVTAVAERVEHFAESGAPRRSWLRLRLVRVDEPSLQQPRAQLARSPVPQWSPNVAVPPEQVRVHEVVGGVPGSVVGGVAGSKEERGPGRPAERLDEIAHREYGDARHWRLIATMNAIDNPLRLPEGLRLAIPDRTVFERHP